MKGFYLRLSVLWSRVACRLWRRYRAKQVEGVYPEELSQGVVYVLTEDGEAWEGKLICPCGCNAVLDLNFIADEHPCWTYRVSKGGHISLHPSVWRQVECKAHFFLRDGRVVWCDE
jgi:hypothetical protein